MKSPASTHPEKGPQQWGIYEAKTKLSELIERVAAGEEIVITRHGTPVARLVPPAADGVNAEQARTILAELRALGRQVGFDPTPEEIRDYINEGRR